MSKITDAERDRRRKEAERDTPQTLAGLLLVAEAIAEGATISWTHANDETMDQATRYDIVKQAILEMQLREIEDDHLDAPRDPGVQQCRPAQSSQGRS